MKLAIFKSNYSYLKAMIKAIDKARYCRSNDTYCSKTDGLRVIRRFEAVNSVKFNPFDGDHVALVSGWAWNESFNRAIKKLCNTQEALAKAKG